MDIMKINQFEELIRQFQKLIDKIEKSEVHTNPFPYILIEDGIDKSLTSDKLIWMSRGCGAASSNGRTSIVLPWDLPFMDELEETIRSKFNLDIEERIGDDEKIILKKDGSSEFWIDSDELDIQDIHLDFLIRDYNSEKYTQNITNEKTQTVISMHIYLPDDDNHQDLGTTLYSVSDDITDEFKNEFFSKGDYPLSIHTSITGDESMLKKYIHEYKKLPFKHGLVYIHPTTLESWHSAPKVPSGYLRKSLMIRWSWTEYVKK
jgi:hypothetical protein